MLVKQVITGFKREYWEHKKLMIIMPLLVTVLFCIVAMVATWNSDNPEKFLENRGVSLNVTVNGEEREADASGLDIDSASTSEQKSGDAGQDTSPPQSNNGTDSENFWFSGVYLAAAWFGSIFYALSTLYSDRRDKSILYWKTMPVSELQTVFTKFLFAIIGFSAVAIVVSWLAAIVLMGYAQLVFPPEMLADDSAGMSFAKLVVWPVLTVVTAIFWCAPIYALILYESARANKMPVLLLIVPIIAIRIIEGLVFKTSYIFSFLYSHTPFYLLARISEMETASQFLHYFWVDSFMSLSLGLMIAALLLWLAAERRDHHFEL